MSRSYRSPLPIAWPVLSLLFLALSASAQSPIDVIGHLPLSEYNTYIKPYAYNDWGNEPFIAVNPINQQDIVISSFAFGSPGASLWYSTDGGASWGIRFPITPNPVAGVSVPNDQTFAYDSNGVLHGVFRGEDSNGNANIYQGTTTDPNLDGTNGRPGSVWQWTAQGQINNPAVNTTAADQPWIAISGSHVFAAYDSFNSSYTLSEVRVVQSTDGGATFPIANDVPITSGGQIFTGPTNPGARIFADGAGYIYSIIGRQTADNGNSVRTIDYRLNRYAIGNSTWDYTSSGTNPGGLTIDSGNSTQGNTTQALSFGGKNMLLGNITAISSTADGSRVYAVYGKQDASGVDRLYLATFVTVAGNLVEQPGAGTTPFSIPGERSALPSIAVTSNGSIAVLYQTTPSTDNFEVHLAMSLNLGLTFTDQTMMTYNTSNISLQGFNRLLGDYESLTALGNTFYGTFPATGDVNSGGINTSNIISPYFFTVTVPEPSAALLVIAGSIVAALMRAHRRRA